MFDTVCRTRASVEPLYPHDNTSVGQHATMGFVLNRCKSKHTFDLCILHGGKFKKESTWETWCGWEDIIKMDLKQRVWSGVV
jgi:hypothetical protein